jgi:hypothetical protein
MFLILNVHRRHCKYTNRNSNQINQEDEMCTAASGSPWITLNRFPESNSLLKNTLSNLNEFQAAGYWLPLQY